MNYQKVYEDVCTHLITQNERCVNDGRCLYRGPRGLKCAIGGIMPDNIYKPSMEGKSPDSEILIPFIEYLGCKYTARDYNGLKVLRGDDIDFLDRLQAIHDSELPEIWKSSLRDFGSDYKLKIPTILND